MSPIQSTDTLPSQTVLEASWNAEKQKSTNNVDMYHGSETNDSPVVQHEKLALEVIPSGSSADPHNWPT